MFKFNSTIARAVAVLAIGAAVTASAVASSSAYEYKPAPTSVPENSIYHSQINDTVEADLMRTPAKSVYNASLNLGIVAEDNLAKPVRDKLNTVGTGAQGPKGDTGPAGSDGVAGPAGPKGADGNPATDALGKGSVVSTLPTANIERVGGSFATRKTELGKFELTPGTWLITNSGVFNRTENAAAGDTVTRPQLALRYDESSTNVWGEDAGTIMGVALSPTRGRELVLSSVKTVTVTKNTTVHIYGFGYNDDTSQTFTGTLTVASSTTATRIG